MNFVLNNNNYTKQLNNYNNNHNNIVTIIQLHCKIIIACIKLNYYNSIIIITPWQNDNGTITISILLQLQNLKTVAQIYLPIK